MTLGRAASDAVDFLRALRVGRGTMVALAFDARTGAALAVPGGARAVAAGGDDPAAVVAAVEAALRPRWVLWNGATALALVRAGVRVATAWDLAAVHRLLFGGWAADPAVVWARLRDLDPAAIPTAAEPDLFSGAQAGDDPEDPVRPDGYLRPDWAAGGWAASPERLVRWAAIASALAGLQAARLDAVGRPSAPATARAESTAELLCAELGVDGLPVDVGVAVATIEALVGPRPTSEADAAAGRARRDAEVLRHVPAGAEVDLRSPGQVRTLLAGVGIEVPDTRAHRLRALAGAHPVVDALLTWRKAERVATTYGYAWLDEHVGPDGRLRGAWSGADGAAGRMTASAGLHNLPADLRGSVRAGPGRVFVRADLGQVEPRVLAAVSGDVTLAAATAEADLYAPVAAALGVDRPTAKVAFLGAMYGQTTGHGATVLRRLTASYPVAMGYLDAADRAARAGRDLRTHGGRLVRMGSGAPGTTSPAAVAARGRYGRNAVVQGAAAELFKIWAVTVRARTADHDARIVLCLHDELLVDAPEPEGAAVAAVVDACLAEAAGRWAGGGAVRFVADTTVIRSWADAKP